MKTTKNELLSEYKYKFELHAHTSPVSCCSEISASDFARDFIEDGFDGVCITNHFSPQLLRFATAKAAAEFYLSDYYSTKAAAGDRLSVCLGMEIRFTENCNDYLVFGVNDADIERAYYYLDKGIDVFYREFKDARKLILQAHPFRNGMVRANPKSLDGIEVYNLHPNHNSRIGEAARYAAENNMIISGGIDFHHEWQRNIFALRCRTLPRDSYEVSELVKSGDLIYTLGDNVIIP